MNVSGAGAAPTILIIDDNPDMALAVSNSVYLEASSGIAFSRARATVSAGGNFPRTKTIARMPAMSAVRTTWGLVSPVRSSVSAWVNASTSLIRSAPQPIWTEMSRSTPVVMTLPSIAFNASRNCIL